MTSVNSSRISTRVGIVDIGIANLGSLYRSLVDIVESVSLVKGPEDLTSIDRLILPGVGSFPEAMKRLRYFELETAIRQFVELDEKPLLGICLGMQLLATIGEEFEETRGLGLIEGRVRKLAAHESVRIPHVGWNSVKFLRQSHLLRGIPDNQDFYFIHSFLFVPSDRRATTAVTVHGEQFTSVVQKDNIAGVQFHPEKSSAMGQRLLLNFCSDS
jgi:glutamine amidotransferase